MRRSFLFATGSLAFSGIAACQSPPPSAPIAGLPPAIGASEAFRQLIIRFKPGTVACDAAAVARFAAEARVSLQVVRPMSGEACVIRQAAKSLQHLQDDLETIKKHPAVQWVEPDAVMKAL
ncbi:MAG: hypothetical protein WBG17_14430 [Burkholderiaceae bacterium]